MTIDGPVTVQARLEADEESEPGVGSVADPVGLFRHLEVTGRFHRDSGIGRVFHPGQLSLREHVPNEFVRVNPLGLQIAYFRVDQAFEDGRR